MAADLRVHVDINVPLVSIADERTCEDDLSGAEFGNVAIPGNARAQNPEELGVEGDAEDIAPCCQETGPCRWDLVCRAHVEGWERSHGCSLLQYLHLNGSFVPPWLEGEGAQPGQRGSTAALAAAAVPIFDKTEDRDVAGLLLDGGGEDALEEVAGRGAFVAEVPLAGSSAMDLDDDDELDNAAPDRVFAIAVEEGERARANSTGALALDEAVRGETSRCEL
jgi:hypothetical protein